MRNYYGRQKTKRKQLPLHISRKPQKFSIIKRKPQGGRGRKGKYGNFCITGIQYIIWKSGRIWFAGGTDTRKQSRNKIMYYDLTKGKISKNLILFALPMMAGNLMQQFYNIADTLIVGRVVGKNALAAVGSAYTLMTFLTSIFLGLSMGAGALFSIYKGKNDKYHIHRIDRHITVQLFCLSASGTWKFHSSTCVFSVILYLEYWTGSAVCCGISLGNPRGGSRDRSFPVCCGNWNPALCCHVAEESA